jgi:hypothetical protein
LQLASLALMVWLLARNATPIGETVDEEPGRAEGSVVEESKERDTTR